MEQTTGLESTPDKPDETTNNKNGGKTISEEITHECEIKEEASENDVVVKTNSLSNEEDTQEKQCDESEMPEEVIEILEREGVKPENIQGVVRELSILQHYEGPLPPPNLLKSYNDIEPGFANRIISMAEKQQDHRIDTIGKQVDTDIYLAKRGLNYAFFLACLLIFGGIVLIILGKDISGLVLLVPGIGTFVVGFLRAAFSNSKDDKENTSEENEGE